MSAPSTNQVPTARTVPQENRSLLVDPPLKQAAGLALGSLQEGISSNAVIGGRSLLGLREWARTDILDSAREYARLLSLPVVDTDAGGPVIVGGHQPSLFHCGVLLKNFAVARLAQHTGGVGLNLLIDNDLATSWHVDVPSGTNGDPHIGKVPFDSPRPPQPWEETTVLDSELFGSFGRRLSAALTAWDIDPLVQRFWPESVKRAEAGLPLSDCLAASRICLQSHWNAHTLELPVSHLSQRPSFLWFVALLLHDAQRFAEQHNQALAVFRRVHRVRSRTHPVADLLTRNEGIETSFWCWRPGDTHRRRLMIHGDGNELVIGNGADFVEALPRGEAGDFEATIDALRALQQEGLRLRPSALTTTLFARLFLANLFVHGIGGSRYDEVSDQLIHEFFGIPAPSFLTISGTLHLPLGPVPDVTANDRQRILAARRRLECNALQILDANDVPELRKRKETLIRDQHADQQDASAASRSRRRARYHAFQDLNSELAAHADPHRQLLTKELEIIDRMLAARSILTHREFSFWLYPDDTLQTFLNESLATLA